MSPREIKKLQARSRALRVEVLSPTVVSVVSRTQPPVQHFVTVEWLGDGAIRARCTCPWGLNGGMCCSHVMAALNELASRKHRVVSFWDDRDVAERQKHRLLRLVGHTDDEQLFLTTRPA
jgi:uncharacterized Zn finger protein